MQGVPKTQILSWGPEDPLEKETVSHFLLEKSHRQRRLAGYDPRGHEKSDTTERLNTHTHIPH